MTTINDPNAQDEIDAEAIVAQVANLPEDVQYYIWDRIGEVTAKPTVAWRSIPFLILFAVLITGVLGSSSLYDSRRALFFCGAVAAGGAWMLVEFAASVFWTVKARWDKRRGSV